MSTKLNMKVLTNVALIAAGLSLVLTVLGLIPFVNFLILCICWFYPLFGAGFAVYAGREHKVNKDSVMDGVVVGAAAGAVSGIAYSVVSSIIGILAALLGISASTLIGGFDQYTGLQFATAGLGSIIGAIIGILIWTVLFTISGAIGGLIYAAVTEKK